MSVGGGAGGNKGTAVMSSGGGDKVGRGGLT